MKNYSIVRVGNEYVVQAGATSVLKVSSRRQAAKLVTVAAELLGRQPVPSADEPPPIGCESGIIPDPAGVILDPARVILDPAWVIPDPSEAP